MINVIVLLWLCERDQADPTRFNSGFCSKLLVIGYLKKRQFGDLDAPGGPADSVGRR